MKIEQWEISEEINLEGQSLKLVGAGVRSMLFLKPYVLAFYGTEEYKDYPAVIASNGAKSMQLIINSEMINATMIVMGFKEGLSRTEFGKLQELKPKFDNMFNLLEQFNIKKGDRVDLFSNDKGELFVFLNEEQKFKEEDNKLTKAIFGIWFSEDFDKKMRNSLLGK